MFVEREGEPIGDYHFIYLFCNLIYRIALINLINIIRQSFFAVVARDQRQLYSQATGRLARGSAPETRLRLPTTIPEHKLNHL